MHHSTFLCFAKNKEEIEIYFNIFRNILERGKDARASGCDHHVTPLYLYFETRLIFLLREIYVKLVS